MINCDDDMYQSYNIDMYQSYNIDMYQSYNIVVTT